MRFFNWLPRHTVPPVTKAARTPRFRPDVETLETRLVPYAVSGNAWPHPELITISVVPDGTMVDGYASDLQATLDARFGSTNTWLNVMKKAAQVWAEQTNINFNFVTDDGVDTGTGDYQQGDPNNGDIRIGGFDFQNLTLGIADMPPPINNWAIAGDITLNTGITFSIGSGTDLFAVTSHEIGHALGLDHGSYGSMMSALYPGALPGLTTDDISGIRNIYSADVARAKDAYDAVAANETFATAKLITSTIDTGTKTALIQNLDLTTKTDVDWYKFVIPTGSTNKLTVRAVATGFSLLAPKIDIYSSANLLKATNTGVGYGSTASASYTGIAAGQTWYVKVSSINSIAAFKTGIYALVLNMGTGDDPTLTYPNTQVLNGDPISSGGGEALIGPGGDSGHDLRGPHFLGDSSLYSAPAFGEQGFGSVISHERASFLALVKTLKARVAEDTDESDLLDSTQSDRNEQTQTDDDFLAKLAEDVVEEAIKLKRGIAPPGKT